LEGLKQLGVRQIKLLPQRSLSVANLLFIFLDFYQKPKKILKNIFKLNFLLINLIKKICKEQKIWRTLQKKAMKFPHARTHAKFYSFGVRRKKLCIDESSSNL
jgi:hypothetical protein